MTTAPPCLRVSLCGASNTRVAADVFHVPVPHLFGAESPYHLLALSEDSESRREPAQQTTAQATAHAIHADPAHMIRQRSPSARSNASSASGSVSTCSSRWQPLPELAGMMLLVDAASPGFDIQQAHLSFERSQTDAEVDPGMPTLRSLCRPTDWESVRSRLRNFRQTTRSEAMQSTKNMNRLCLRMPDDPRKFLMAKSVVLSAFRVPERPEDDVKICLQLSDFVQDESRLRQLPDLEGIQEQMPPLPGM